MNRFTARIALTAALLAASAWACANEPIRLAQLSPEERHRLHERWEHASPEERAALRRELRERWGDAPPEQREQQRLRLMEQMNRQAPRDYDRPREQWQESQPNRYPRDGFGAGFEQRRIENPPPERPFRPRR